MGFDSAGYPQGLGCIYSFLDKTRQYGQWMYNTKQIFT